MAKAVNAEEVETLASYFERATHRLDSGARLWYRGCGSEKYALLPGLYRHPVKKDFVDFQGLEDQMLRSFRDRAMPFYDHMPHDEDRWSLLFLMQHYRVPTRLLDWTESPLIALYFALESALRINDDVPAVVWILNPIQWNSQSLEQITRGNALADIPTKGDMLLNSWQPRKEPFGGTPYAGPVALLAPHNNARIVAQRGTFTIFGSSTADMEKQFLSENYPGDALEKLLIPKDRVAAMMTALTRIGQTDSVIFPDLEGLAKELRREWGFE